MRGGKPQQVLVSAAVMAVPERSKMVGELLSALDWDYVPVHWDVEHEGTVPSFIQTVKVALDAQPSCSHVLILQDDIQPCRDFIAGVHAALRARSRWPISFWNADKRPETKVLARNRTFIELSEWCGTLAVALPHDVARMFLAWVPDAAERVTRMGREEFPEYPHPERFATCDDSLLRYFFREHGITLWHSFPSLVEHRAPKESVAGSMLDAWHRAQRVSPWFIGEERSALSVPWR